MGTRFIRKGHERINSHGTKSWVTEHEVHKNYFTVTKVANRSLINGKEPLRETRCRHCRAVVFEVALPKGRNVLFNNDYNPLVRHKCEQSKSLILEKGPPRKAKRFLSDAAVEAQNKAINELKAKRKKRELQQLEQIEKERESLSEAKKRLQRKIQKVSGGQEQKTNISKLQLKLNILQIDMQMGLQLLGIDSVRKLPAGHKLKVLEARIKKEKLWLKEQQRALSSKAGRDIAVKGDNKTDVQRRKVSTSERMVGSRRLRKIKQEIKTKYGAKKIYLLIERYSIQRDLSSTKQSYDQFQKLIDQNKNLLEKIEKKEKLKIPFKRRYGSLQEIEKIIANYKKAIKDLRLQKSSSNRMHRGKIENEILKKNEQISKLEKEKSFFNA